MGAYFTQQITRICPALDSNVPVGLTLRVECHHPAADTGVMHIPSLKTRSLKEWALRLRLLAACTPVGGGFHGWSDLVFAARPRVLAPSTTS
jgi:hypothetical protein